MDWNKLIDLDRQLLLWFNGSNSGFLDALVLTFTSGFTWVPLYVAFLYVIFRNSLSWRQVLLTVACALLCLLLSDGLPDGIVKPLVGRLRPSHDPALAHSIRLVNGYRHTLYGFFSAHASNTLALALFFSKLVSRRWVTVVLVAWSMLNCWTRMYLGVHYPTDILVGLLWGVLSAFVASYVHQKTFKQFLHRPVEPHRLGSNSIGLALLLGCCYVLVRAISETWIQNI